MALPHITNSQAGTNRWDPVHNCMFEVYFTVPAAIQTEYGADVALLTEQVQSVEGLDGIDKAPAVVEQKFMGTTRSALAPKVDTTSLDITIKFALNLRNSTDNFVYKLFRAWNQLGYNINNGQTSTKPVYTADWIKLSIANRGNNIIRNILLKDVMLTSLSGATGTLDYSTTDPMELTVGFRTDHWDDLDAI